MLEINIETIAYEDVWERDKELLRLSIADLDIDWSSILLTPKDAGTMLYAQSDAWLHPQNPIEITEPYVSDLTTKLIAEIEDVWKTKFMDRPRVESVDSKRYLSELNNKSRKANLLLGAGAELASPPTCGLFPYDGSIVIPKDHVVRVPKGESTSLMSSDFDNAELPWDRHFYEMILCNSLSKSLFRQLRGEWKNEFVNAMKDLTPDAEESIQGINELLAQYTVETIVRRTRNEWGFYAACEKIHLVWQDRTGMHNYIAIEALSNMKELFQISMMDNVEILRPSLLQVDFYTGHPQWSRKESIFLKE